MAECIPVDIQEIKEDVQIEEQITKQLLVLERDLQAHFTLMKNEIALQNELVARIWKLSQKYNLLERNPCRGYLETNTDPAEDAFLLEFSDKLTQIRNSNCHISSSLSGVRKAYKVFEDLCAELDMNTGSSLIIGGVFHKPLSYFIELISDIIKFFHAWILKLIYCSNQFEPTKVNTIEQYKNHIEISTNFEEYFHLGLSYCKCLRFKTKF